MTLPRHHEEAIDLVTARVLSAVSGWFTTVFHSAANLVADWLLLDSDVFFLCGGV